MTILGMLVLSTQLLAAPESDTISTEHVRAFYPEIFPAEVVSIPGHDRRFLTHPPPRPSATHLLKGITGVHMPLLRFLLVHGTGVEIGDVLLSSADSATAVRRYHERLQADSLFDQRLMPLVARYLRAQGATLSHELATYAVTPRRAVPLQAVVDAAARLYYPDQLPDGRLGLHICTVAKGLEGMPREKRDPYVEALAYATMYRDQQHRAATKAKTELFTSLWAEWVEIHNAADLPTDKDQRIAEIRHRFWTRIARNELLRQAVLEEYERQREILPITISTGPPRQSADSQSRSQL